MTPMESPDDARSSRPRQPAPGPVDSVDSVDSVDILIAVARWTRYVILFASAFVILALVIGGAITGLGAPSRPAHGAAQRPASPVDQVTLDIMPVKPGGPAQGFAAYLPATTLSAPAQSLVTFTIRNFDLDATPLPPGSTANQAHGTVGGVAYADGQAYTALDRARIAHTFTVPALHLNVPIPGYSASGKGYVTVTFRVRTGQAGVYEWRCMAPCGEGQDGLAGPMTGDAYMRGALIIQA